MSKFVLMGTGSSVNVDKVIGLATYEGNGVKKQVIRAKDNEKAIDMTRGKKISTVLFMEKDTVILLSTTLETVQKRLENANS